jgi:hypothetical protein
MTPCLGRRGRPGCPRCVGGHLMGMLAETVRMQVGVADHLLGLSADDGASAGTTPCLGRRGRPGCPRCAWDTGEVLDEKVRLRVGAVDHIFGLCADDHASAVMTPCLRRRGRPGSPRCAGGHWWWCSLNW